MTDKQQSKIWAMLPEWFQQALIEEWQNANEILAYDRNNRYADHTIRLWKKFFGEQNMSETTPKSPSEPKFKVGDIVVVVSKESLLECAGGGHCTVISVKPHGYHIQSSTGKWFALESDLAPYTEPIEESKTSTENEPIPTENGNSSENNPLDVAKSAKPSVGKLVIPVKAEFDDSVYAAYRLDLAKEIALRLINNSDRDTHFVHVFAKVAVDMANEIVKRLKETEV